MGGEGENKKMGGEKGKMKTKIASVLGLAILVCSLAAIGVMAIGSPTASIKPETQMVGAGENFTFNVSFDPAGDGFVGGSIILKFNASVIQVNAVNPGDLLGEEYYEAPTNEIDNTNGTVRYEAVRLGGISPPAPAGNFTVISASVREDAPSGTYYLNITKAEFADENGDPIPGIVVENGSITVLAPDTTAPTTEVTPSGVLPWTEKNVTLSFRRSDNGGGNISGVAYTNLSLAAESEADTLNVIISNNSWAMDRTLKKGENVTVPFDEIFGEYFNVTISEECNATIEYYSVDNAGNPETPKTVTVRIKYPTTGNVSINEIMYAPNKEWGGQYNEWIELYNRDDKTINLTGWEIDGKKIPDGTVIQPQGYLIIARNDTSFAETYPGAVCSVVRVSIELKNDGEELFLNDSAGNVVDSVNYTPYAAENLGKNGKTLERNETAWEESIRNGGTPCQRNSVLPPTSFVIDGYVFYEDNTACKNPTVKITNDKIGEWFAENWTDSNYYRLTLKSTAEVMAGDTLRIDASSPDDTQINVTTFEVTQADIDKGGVRINVTVTPPAAPEPEIISWSPEESIVNNTEGESRRFNITVDQVVNVSWLINGTEVFSESGVNESEYTNTSAVPGLWNVSVIVENENGTDMHSWIWNVTKVAVVAAPPNITEWYPVATEISNNAGESREFKVKANQTVNVSWYINGSLVHENISVPAFVNATYTNTSAVPGLWNVSVIVENENGTDMHSWIWNVRSPYAVELSVEPPMYVCVRPNENATFRIIVKNNGTEPDKFNLTVEAPGNVNAILSKKETSELDPGETENITLNVSTSQIGEYIVSVTATSQNDPSVSDTVTTTTNVTEVPHRIVELVYNENNKGYNYIAWTGDYTINASDLVSMIRKGAGERAFPDDAFIAYFNTTSGDWEIFFGDGTGTTNFKLRQYDVVCVRVADEGKFYMPVP